MDTEGIGLPVYTTDFIRFSFATIADGREG